MKMLQLNLHKKLPQIWYSKNVIALMLWPLSLLYQLLFKLHKLIYQLGIKKPYRSTLPVIVVGNITVGGTGKTPFTIALAELLMTNGYNPGIVSRGYKAATRTFPHVVAPDDCAKLFGDEPVLLAKKIDAPVIVSPQRKEGVKVLEQQNCDVVICDDGLQHHALQKDIEVILVDGARRFGNGFCLPAGPLRESNKQLSKKEFVVAHGNSDIEKYQMRLSTCEIYNLTHPQLKLNWNEIQVKQVHAVAAIGHPQRFFDTLRELGITITEHEFPDHYQYNQADFEFCDEDDLLIMTEKDAVKCRQWARDNYWVLAVKASLSENFKTDLLSRLRALDVKKLPRKAI